LIWQGKALVFHSNPIQSELEVADFAKNRGWRLKLISGTQIKIQWLFGSTEKGTRVTYMIEYRLPFGLMGRVIDNLIIRRLTEKGMEKTLQELKDLLEKQTVSASRLL